MRRTALTTFALAAGLVTALAARGGEPGEVRPGGRSVEPAPPVVFEFGRTRVECRDGEVAGLRAGDEAWKILHPSIRGVRRRPGRVTSPVAFGGRLYYGTGGYALEVDVEAGRVLRRLIFPGAVTKLAPGSDGVTIAYGRARGHYHYDAEFVLRPGGREPQLRLGGDLRPARSPSSDASDIARGVSRGPRRPRSRPGKPVDEAERKRRDEDRRKRREEAARLLAGQAERDPTNPFLRVERAKLLVELGREDDARAEIEKTLLVEGNARVLLVGASTVIEELGFTDLAERAFETGYRVFLESGHEPELFSTLITLMIHYGSTGQAVHAYIEAGELDRAARVLERTWRLAPRCEAVAFAFQGMARKFEEAGRGDEAAKWRARAEHAAPAIMFGGIGKYAGFAGQGMNAFWAAHLAFYLFLALLVVRCLPLHRREIRRLGGLRAALRTGEGRRALLVPTGVSRWELASLVALMLVSWTASVFAARGIAAVARGAAIELDSASGNWGSLPSVMHWQRNATTPEGRELQALSLIHAGRLDEARAVLRDLSQRSAEAENNLGVILKLKGRDEDAGRAFERALDLDPGLPEALHNLGRETGGSRAERAAKYLPGKPLLAVPSPETHSRAMAADAGRPGQWLPLWFLGVHGTHAGLLGRSRRIWREVGSAIVALSTPVMFVIGIVSLVLIFLVSKDRPAAEAGAGWWMGLAVPGAARAFAPLGALVLGCHFYCGIVRHYHAGFPGATSLIDQIAVPNLIMGFGVGSALPGWGGGVLLAGILVWAIPILSAAGMIGLRLVKRESWADDVSLRWALVRAGVLLVGGVLVAALMPGVVFRLPGVILALAGAASGVVALRRAKTTPSASGEAGAGGGE